MLNRPMIHVYYYLSNYTTITSVNKTRMKKKLFEVCLVFLDHLLHPCFGPALVFFTVDKLALQIFT